uniref:Uncharacterized protein n=1 Tax=Romanomermis culicivorax TaxID=13658 RepID=A0A915J9P4_ROMCU
MMDALLNGTLFGLATVYSSTPEHLKKKFADFPPIIKHAEINLEDIGEHMQKYALDTDQMKNPRQCLMSSYFGKTSKAGIAAVHEDSISKEFKQSTRKKSLSINRTKKIDSRLQPLVVDYPDLKVVKVIRNPKNEHVSTTQLPSLDMKSAIKDRTTLISLATNPSISRRSLAPSTKTNVDWEGRKIPKPISRPQCALLILLFVGMLITLTFIFLYLTQSFSSDDELSDATSSTRVPVRTRVTGLNNNEDEDDVDEDDDGNGEKIATAGSSQSFTTTIMTTITTARGI